MEWRGAWGGQGPLTNDGNSGTSYFARVPSQADLCYAYLASWPEGCDRYNNPAQLIVNGCGKPGGFPIPDSLVVLDDTYDSSLAAEAASFGNVFTAGCNLHDQCYATYSADSNKQECDEALEQDMVDSARAMIPTSRWTAFELNVKAQAYAYSKGLAWGLIELIVSNAAYQVGQKEGKCRYYAANTNLLNC